MCVCVYHYIYIYIYIYLRGGVSRNRDHRRNRKPNFKSSAECMYLTNSSTGCDTMSVFLWSPTGLNLEFSFSYVGRYSKAEEPCLLYYLPIAWGEEWTDVFIAWSRALVLKKMQTASSMIWIWVAVSISQDDNRYAMFHSSCSPL